MTETKYCYVGLCDKPCQLATNPILSDDVIGLRCVHGHGFDVSGDDMAWLDEISREEQFEILKDWCNKVEDNEFLAIIEQSFVDFDNEQWKDKMEGYLWEAVSTGGGVPEKYCPVCKKIKEFEKDPEYKEYLRLADKFTL